MDEYNFYKIKKQQTIVSLELEGRHTKAMRMKFNLPNDDWEFHRPDEWQVQWCHGRTYSTKIPWWVNCRQREAKATNKACIDAMWKAASKIRPILAWDKSLKAWVPVVHRRVSGEFGEAPYEEWVEPVNQNPLWCGSHARKEYRIGYFEHFAWMPPDPVVD